MNADRSSVSTLGSIRARAAYTGASETGEMEVDIVVEIVVEIVVMAIRPVVSTPTPSRLWLLAREAICKAVGRCSDGDKRGGGRRCGKQVESSVEVCV